MIIVFSDKFLILFATSRPFISGISISRKTTSYGFCSCCSRKDTAFKYLSKEISISNSLKHAFIFLLKQSRYTFSSSHSDYYKETVLAAPDAQRLSRYLDLLTIWSGDSEDYSYSGMCKYQNNLYLQTNNYKVFVLDLNTGTRRLLFSENYINGDISVIDGKVFYLNSDGNPVCYDNEKKIISERMFYAIASDGEYIYCSNKSATYRYKASDFTEEKLADKGDAYMVDRGGVYFDDGTYMDAGGNLIEIPQAKDGRIFLANGKVIVRNSDGELQFSDK